MYFESRAQAGAILAAQLLEKYRYEDCAVVALSDGAVLVGEQIAAQLHCILTLLVTEEIVLPGEDQALGSVAQGGVFSYNNQFSTGEIEEYNAEFHGYINEERRRAFSKINRLLGDGGTIDREMLNNRNIILVSDGFANGNIMNAVMDFLKPISVQKLIAVAPTATVAVVDQLHVAMDDICILDVKENFMGIDHYYEDNYVPSHEETIEKINQIILNWR